MDWEMNARKPTPMADTVAPTNQLTVPVEPTAAVASVPREPTMAVSIYCTAVCISCSSIVGQASATTVFSMAPSSLPFSLIRPSSSLPDRLFGAQRPVYHIFSEKAEVFPASPAAACVMLRSHAILHAIGMKRNVKDEDRGAAASHHSAAKAPAEKRGDSGDGNLSESGKSSL